MNFKPEGMTISGVAGCTEWSEPGKTARIEIIDPEYYGDRIVPFDFEKTLIHELLHLKMSFWCQNGDDVEDRVMHQIIDDLARAFAERKTSENAPTADVHEVKHGHWIEMNSDMGIYRCSQCREIVGAQTRSRFCPNCGAIMDEEEK